MNNKILQQNRVALFLLFSCSFLAVAWTLSDKNWLIFDDVTNLTFTTFNSYSQHFSLFPTQYYNNRPVAIIILKVLVDIFKDNYIAIHCCFVATHLLNVFFVYIITISIFKLSLKESNIWAIVAASIFGIFPISIMAPSWISALYDLFCVMFALISIIMYLQAKTSDKYKLFYYALSLTAYILSMRSKEMAMVLPLIYLLYDFNTALKSKKPYKVSKSIVLFLITMSLYALLTMFSKESDFAPDNPYFQNFSIITLLRNAIRYLFLYFDFSNSTFTFQTYSFAAIPGVLFFVIILLFGIYSMVAKRNYSIMFAVLSVGVSLGVVLPMVNMQHRLYLYFPSIFIGITVALFFKTINQYRFFKNIKNLLILLPIFIYSLSFTKSEIAFRDFWLTTAQADKAGHDQVKRLEPPRKGSNIYIKNASNGYNIFNPYGPGNCIKLFFHEEDFNILLVDDFPNNPLLPFLLLDYADNQLIEIDRNNDIPPPQIISVYPASLEGTDLLLTENGDVNIGVVLEKITESVIICVNAEELPTIYGDTFISATIPAKYLEEDTIEIYVYDNETDMCSEVVALKK